MAITGSGTEQDPWVVTTYDELVEKAANSGEYVKIANDINITDEYPDGNMPQLSLQAIVDGNNKKISNWYKTSGEPIYIDTGSAQLRDCTLANIYAKGGACFAVCNRYNADYHFVNCKFHGVIWMPLLQAIDDNYSYNNFSSCSFYIENKGNEPTIVNNNWSYIGMRYCYIKVKNVGTATSLFNTTRSTHIESCYIESDVPCGCYGDMNNSVLDITTNETFTASGNSSHDLCILNSTHAPNASVGNGFALVDSEHWTNVGYLNSIGFNAG